MQPAAVRGRQRTNVAGHHRVITYEAVIFASSGDFLEVPGMKIIFEIALAPVTPGSPPYSWLVMGNTIQFLASAPIMFQGSIYGL